MRRYFQGTLDYTCGIYAVINALARLYDIRLSAARSIYHETIAAISQHPVAWQAFIRNTTDHYFVVRYMLQTLAQTEFFAFTWQWPYFADAVPAINPEALLTKPELYIGEQIPDFSPAGYSAYSHKTNMTWETLNSWLIGNSSAKRTAIFRFHRYICNSAQPLVSHWTTAKTFTGNTLLLHDSSQEDGALAQISRSSLFASNGTMPAVTIPSESLVLLERQR